MSKTVEYAGNNESVMCATDHEFSEDKKELAYEYVTTANRVVQDDPRCHDLERRLHLPDRHLRDVCRPDQRREAGVGRCRQCGAEGYGVIGCEL